MRRPGRSIGLLLAVSASLAGAGCGKYGPPQRVRPVPGAAAAGVIPAAGEPAPLPIEDPAAPDPMGPDEPLFEERIGDPQDE